MKKCTTCNRTFTDDALSFCLDDGSPLLSVGADTGPSSYDPGATIQYNPARDTNPPPPAYPPPQVPGAQIQPPAWTPIPSVGGMQAQPPAKKSKAMYWILGVVALLVVLGVGGIALVFVLVGMSNSNSNNSNANNSNATVNANANANKQNSNNSNTSNANTNAGNEPGRTYVVQDDFSGTTMWAGTNSFGTAKYVNGEYQLAATGGYIVVYAPKTYETKDATTRVTTHSVDGTSPPKGYGLAVFGLLKDGSLEDYAFLITTDDNPNFRVVLHNAGKETPIVNATSSSLIRSGSSPNQLEVRTNGAQLTFYINGQYATSITDSAGYKAGAAGFYTSGTSTVAFDDLEIFK